MTRLDQNRAQAQIAARLGTGIGKVSNVIIWGNHSSTQFPDAKHAKVQLSPDQTVSVYEAVKDDAWLQGEFVSVSVSFIDLNYVRYNSNSFFKIINLTLYE